MEIDMQPAKLCWVHYTHPHTCKHTYMHTHTSSSLHFLLAKTTSMPRKKPKFTSSHIVLQSSRSNRSAATKWLAAVLSLCPPLIIMYNYVHVVCLISDSSSCCIIYVQYIHAYTHTHTHNTHTHTTHTHNTQHTHTQHTHTHHTQQCESN